MTPFERGFDFRRGENYTNIQELALCAVATRQRPGLAPEETRWS